MISIPPNETPGNAQQTTALQPVDLRQPAEFTKYFTGLVTSCNSYVLPGIEASRDAREMVVDVDALRNDNIIDAGQTYIPQRIIDINIQRDMPDHIAYLTQARRLAIFSPIAEPNSTDTNMIEMEFRRVMTYENWIFDYERWADSTKLHGWGFVDVCHDESYPGHVSVEYIAAGNLLFDPRVKCIQQSPIVARRYQITSVDLLEMAEDYKFDPAVVKELYNKLIASEQNPVSSDQECNFIYRCFFKTGGYVYANWYTYDLKKHLKPAEQFWNGVSEQTTQVVLDPAGFGLVEQTVWVNVYERDYPFFVYRNRVTEEEPIVRTLGRGILDYYTQEAASSLWSSYVNGTKLGSIVMWSPEDADAEAPTAPGQLDIQIKQGAIWNRPMKAFSAPYPDAQLPAALDMLRTQNAEDTNQVSFATNNRKDTRKTATEIQAAAAQDAQMSSVSATNWATAIGAVLDAAWRIIRSAALQGKITFCAVNGQNNLEYIARDYKLIPAGTTDYVERMELIASMAADLPVLTQTAAGPVFLEEYLRLKYPVIADKLIAPLQAQQAQAQQVIPVLQNLLQQAVVDENGQLRPEWQPHAAELQKLGIKPNGPANQPTNDSASAPADNGNGDSASTISAAA